MTDKPYMREIPDPPSDNRSNDLVTALIGKVQRCEDFWSRIGAHTSATTEQGRHLRAFFVKVWDRWSASVLRIAGEPLTRNQAGTFLYNASLQLEQILFVAQTQYQLPVPDLDLGGAA